MFLFPKLYGLEFAILPVVSLPTIYWWGDFTFPVVMVNNSIITAVCALAAGWRSRQIAAAMGRGHRDRLAPMWPALVGLLLAFFAALQVIFCVAHLSYFRDGPLVPDLFDH